MMDILLVEDDAVFAAMLARSLQRRGHAVRHAANVAAALQEVASAPQAIILDLNLDGDSGLRLLPQLLAAAPQARLLVLTGYASIATAVEAVKLGAVNYLAKPASADEILAALGTVAADPERALPAAPMSLKRVSWEHLQRVLAEHDGNVSATARALNMHRRSVQRMLAKRPVRD
ncbi:response regulator transcription factor [Vogesella indigofera]|uniref:response regulator transcription factor n=1 Tax=Vogesella indigofera TaxID=45465 RepID=UPI00234EBEA9|nr:response regulator [Vogesella indigofera]MDC7706342.1 response regulator [Vogesella indigofera]MDC7711951.1 response regulator [Vogesella indigofera]